MKCPTNCSGSTRTRELTTGEQESILEQDSAMSEHLNRSTMRCSYCGAVFQPSTPSKTLGVYGGSMSGGNGFDWVRR